MASPFRNAVSEREGGVREEFRSGLVYRYFTVPRAIAEGLQVADSKGADFNRRIKARVPYQRLV